MLKKKHSSSDKKRKRSRSAERHDKDERKPAVTKLTLDSNELADAELDRISSDMEEGGLNLSLLFQPITAYVSNKREMLEQCFHVLGEKKLHKMLPEELKDCSLEEIKTLCWEQLEPISEKNLLEILAGEDITLQEDDKNPEEILVGQQDNNVDSTSCLKEMAKTEDPKQECTASGEESDVLSINADTYDSDIEGPKEEQNIKTAEKAVKSRDIADLTANPDPVKPESNPGSPSRSEKKKDIQSDIDKSMSVHLLRADLLQILLLEPVSRPFNNWSFWNWR
uniref:Caspase activity and apoptosis inhibitor 1 n=1 Tax=Cynoglossus semilaevis TaxID=244447 RepID=A0A3P8V707_CYNSE